MPLNDELLARRAAVLPRGVPRVTTVTAATARGAIITDVEGRRIIDFAGGIGVMNAGHCDESVVAAIREQAGRLLHTCIHVATYEPYVALCEKLVSLFPHGRQTKAFLLNSGAEAVENAVKIARQATGRPGIVCYSESFHGRTLLGMSLTSKVKYKTGCGPFAPEIYRLPFPNRFRYGDDLPEDRFVERELDRLRGAFDTMVAATDVAAILIEPVQGEGGFVPAPAEYLRGVRGICDEHGIVLIFDEVQSGFCRTGRWAAYQHFGVVPDLSTWAKSMGGGLPISAVIGRADVMDAAVPGTIGGTYGGNPVACAASLATIAVMEKLDLNARAVEVGGRIRDRLEDLRDHVPELVDVRGLGAMVGAEFCEDGNPARPATAQVGNIQRACLERGVLTIAAGTYGNVIRILSPLVITDDELDEGLDIMEAEIVRAFAAPGSPAVAAHQA
ncbi:MAG TPA: aspartate aminotransferase family protein [Longimicrobiales bacterium]|nr:aspartate aminotransferase family protein [Longimicrobiales bacterium]